MLRRFVEHGFVSRDSVLDAILLQESLGAIQMFADVYGHLLRSPLRFYRKRNRKRRGSCASDPFSLYTGAGSQPKKVQSAMWYAARVIAWTLQIAFST